MFFLLTQLYIVLKLHEVNVNCPRYAISPILLLTLRRSHIQTIRNMQEKQPVRFYCWLWGVRIYEISVLSLGEPNVLVCLQSWFVAGGHHHISQSQTRILLAPQTKYLWWMLSLSFFRNTFVLISLVVGKVKSCLCPRCAGSDPRSIQQVNIVKYCVACRGREACLADPVAWVEVGGDGCEAPALASAAL